jgi:hypothetical protein
MPGQIKIQIEIEQPTHNTSEQVKKEIMTININKPSSIVDFGLSQSKQLEFIERIQDIVLQEQANLLDHGPEECPDCGKQVWKNGKAPSSFHHIYSDHRVFLQKWICPTPLCSWSLTPSVKSILGSSSHAELIRLQVSRGARFSYEESSVSLGESLGENRPINNRYQILRNVRLIGELTEKRNKDGLDAPSFSARELIAQADGGYLHDWANKGHNFEAMVSKIYRPENVIELSKDRYEIVDKNCAGSAKSDSQETMGDLVISAAKRQGMTESTNVIALADGAKNCWNILRVLKGLCGTLLFILDWFHIEKKLSKLYQKVSCFTSFQKEVIRESLWGGQPKMALRILRYVLKKTAEQEKTVQYQEFINDFLTYIDNNSEMIVNYKERKEQGKAYTSSVVESTVEHLLNKRMRKKQKMGWTREGAHAILQVRSAMASGEWADIWKDIERNELTQMSSEAA